MAEGSGRPDAVVAASSSPLEDELRQACFQYYLAQQGLQTAEDDHLQLQNALVHVKDQLEARRRDTNQLREVRRGLEGQADAMRYLPRGTSPETGRKYLEAERTLHTRISVADGTLEQLRHNTQKALAQVERDAKTVAVLEQSLTAQRQFGEALAASLREGIAKVKHEERRVALLRARRATLEAALQAERITERKLKSSVANAVEMRERAQREMRSQDAQALRMRSDVAFGRRLHLSELEHAREQQLWIDELALENKRLKVLAANTRKDAPVNLGKRCAGGEQGEEEEGVRASPADCVIESTGLKGAARGSSGAIKQTRQIAVTDVDVVAASKAPEAPAQHQTKERLLLDKFRHYNMSLLQQLVNSMQLLQAQVAPPV